MAFVKIDRDSLRRQEKFAVQDEWIFVCTENEPSNKWNIDFADSIIL